MLVIYPDNAVECTPSSIQAALLPVNTENMMKKAPVLYAVERDRHELRTKVFEYLDVRADKRESQRTLTHTVSCHHVTLHVAYCATFLQVQSEHDHALEYNLSAIKNDLDQEDNVCDICYTPRSCTQPLTCHTLCRRCSQSLKLSWLRYGYRSRYCLFVDLRSQSWQSINLFQLMMLSTTSRMSTTLDVSAPQRCLRMCHIFSMSPSR